MPPEQLTLFSKKQHASLSINIGRSRILDSTRHDHPLAASQWKPHKKKCGDYEPDAANQPEKVVCQLGVVKNHPTIPAPVYWNSCAMKPVLSTNYINVFRAWICESWILVCLNMGCLQLNINDNPSFQFVSLFLDFPGVCADSISCHCLGCTVSFHDILLKTNNMLISERNRISYFFFPYYIVIINCMLLYSIPLILNTPILWPKYVISCPTKPY